MGRSARRVECGSAQQRSAAGGRCRRRLPVARRGSLASIVGDSRVVFNIRGNRYRLVVAVNYAFGIVYIRFVGTHSAYDAIDVATV